MAQNTPISLDLSEAGRKARILTLKMRGLNDNEISKRMKEEGYDKVSRRTIQRILKTISKAEMVDELLAQQQRDITQADIEIRLKFRDRLLDKYIPQNIKQEITANPSIIVEFSDKIKTVNPNDTKPTSS